MTIPRTIPWLLVSLCALPVSGVGQTMTGLLFDRDGSSYDAFGDAVALSESLLVVGSRGWEPSTSYQDVGGVQVYVRTAGGWDPVERLVPSVPAHHAGFGRALAVSGSLIAVGAPGDGHQEEETGLVYLFEDDPAGWRQSQILRAGSSSTDDRFGSALTFDGDTLVIGAPRADPNGLETGEAYTYRQLASQWHEVGSLSPPTRATAGWRFGQAVAAEGGRIAVGAPGAFEGSGRVYLFGNPAGASPSIATFEGSDSRTGAEFGGAIAMDGGWIVVGAPGVSNVDLFELGPNGYEHRGCLSSPVDELGFGSSLSLSGGWLAVRGAPASELVWLYRRSGSGWVQVSSVASVGGGSATGDAFGMGVALLGTGLVIGSPAARERGLVSLYSLESGPHVETICWGATCPCGNGSALGGCMNSSGHGARLSAWGSLDANSAGVRFALESGPANRLAILIAGARSTPVFLGDGVRCVGPGPPGMSTFRFLQKTQLNENGCGKFSNLPGEARFALDVGTSIRLQCLLRDPTGPCGAGFNTSNGLVLEWPL